MMHGCRVARARFTRCRHTDLWRAALVAMENREERPCAGPADRPVADGHPSRSLPQDAMATEKLADGIRKFAADLEKLEQIVKARLG